MFPLVWIVFVITFNFARAEENRSLYRGLRYIEGSLNRGSTVKKLLKRTLIHLPQPRKNAAKRSRHVGI